LFSQIPKVRKITNPKEKETEDKNSSSSSSSPSSSSSSDSSPHTFIDIPIEPMSDFERQFHPLIIPVHDAAPLDCRVNVNIMKKGRIVNQSLTASEVEFFAEQKNTFEILHNKIPKDQYRAIQERARLNINNVFADMEIARVDKSLPGDARGAALQRHAITLAREGMTAFQCID
jgi:hypothetical protein